jgi:hypothetical protein
MAFASYSPEDVVFLLGGIIPITGFAEGGFISISKASPIYETVVSSDGRVSRTQVENPLYTVKLSLSSVAQDNEVLTALSFLDRKTSRGKVPLLIRDHLGTSMFYASLAWLEGIPEVSYGVDVGQRDWVFSCIGVTELIGGNESSSEIPSPLLAIGSEVINRIVG